MAVAPRFFITEHFVRSPGPGGQNVNKVATAVELRVDVGASALADDVKARLRKLAGSRMTADGILIIHAHQHRTQARNREAARARLDDLIERASRRPRPRRATKPSAMARERRVQAKKTRGVLKRFRTQTGKRSDED
jgi:ribosome-associated protein